MFDILFPLSVSQLNFLLLSYDDVVGIWENIFIFFIYPLEKIKLLMKLLMTK